MRSWVRGAWIGSAVGLWLTASCSGDKTATDTGGGDADVDADADADTDTDTDADADPDCPGLGNATVCTGEQIATTTTTIPGGSGSGTQTVTNTQACPEVGLQFSTTGNVRIITFDTTCTRTEEASTWSCSIDQATIDGHGTGTWDQTTGTLETSEWGTMTVAGCP